MLAAPVALFNIYSYIYSALLLHLS